MSGVTGLGVVCGRMGPQLRHDWLQKLSESQQRSNVDRGHWRELVLCGRWTGHPSGDIQVFARRIDNGEGAVCVPGLRKDLELPAVVRVKRIVDRDARTYGLMNRVAFILMFTRWSPTVCSIPTAPSSPPFVGRQPLNSLATAHRRGKAIEIPQIQ